ncbi:carbohydrate deacetylase [Bacillus piscicola]|uniref:carbohydrate deacetylase n=1 Tax=Bacillus piscicola TaxID=1632684 RepID=UPI001F08D668|nr:carbohydrate deacetylase [Bacillus piscicola]
MKQLIINGDDFGYSSGVNYGIIDAHRNGILTSATLLTNMPGAAQAYELARAHPALGVGIHLNLTLGKALSSGHDTLTGKDGSFHPCSYYRSGGSVDPEEVYREWQAQMESALREGLTPTHLDSHHHVHSCPGLTEVFTELAREYNLPTRTLFPEGAEVAVNAGQRQEDDKLRGVQTVAAKEIQAATPVDKKEKTNPVPKTTVLGFAPKTPDHFEASIDVLYQSPDVLATLFAEAATIEIMTHPAYLDKPLVDQSSLLYPRLEDFTALTDKTILDSLTSAVKVELVSYRALQRD